MPGDVTRPLGVDKMSAVAMRNGGHGIQRNRHLKIRANFLREGVEQGRSEVHHTPGEVRLADLATK